MAVLVPKKLHDFLDKLPRPSKDIFLEQDGTSQVTIALIIRCRAFEPDSMVG